MNSWVASTIHNTILASTIHNPSPRRRREREISEDLEQTQSIFIEPPHSSFVFVVLPQYNSRWVARQEIPTTQTQTQHPFFSPWAASSSLASNSKWELFLCSAFFKDFNFIFQSTLASMMHRKLYWNLIYWATFFLALPKKFFCHQKILIYTILLKQLKPGGQGLGLEVFLGPALPAINTLRWSPGLFEVACSYSVTSI